MYEAKKERYEEMSYSYTGKSGLQLPRVSLGLWHNFGDHDDYENIKAMCFTAFDRGITHFDLANNYGPEPGGAERNFGRVLREEMGAYRDEMIISTKAGYDMWAGPYGRGGSRKYLLASLDQSLLRMGLDYVDIFYHHCPDKNTPLEESMMALDAAVKSGKALYAGISNYDGEGMRRAAEILTELKCPFIINQNAYNILNRTIEQNGLVEAAKECGKGIICFSPLAQGLLTDRYLDGIPSDSRIATSGRFLKASALTDGTMQKINALNRLALIRGETLAQMALKWVLANDAVTSVLVGASKPSQILDDIRATEGVPLTAYELAEIDKIAFK